MRQFLPTSCIDRYHDLAMDPGDVTEMEGTADLSRIINHGVSFIPGKIRLWW